VAFLAAGKGQVDVLECDPAHGQPGQADLPLEGPAGEGVQHSHLVLGPDLDLATVGRLGGDRQLGD
jgi:hypothetical protein